MAEHIDPFGDPDYQAMLAEESRRGVSDYDLESIGHTVYGSDVDVRREAAQLLENFVEPLEGPLVPRLPRKE